MSLLRGCPIPDTGTPVVHALCFPDTWAGLLSELFLPPTDPDFWELAASDADKDAATQVAHQIVHDFLSVDCVCGSCPPLGAFHEDVFDFRNDPYGWFVTDPVTMQWSSGVGFEALPVTGFFTGKRLTIRKYPAAPVTTTRLYTWGTTTRLVYALPGNPLTFASARIDAWPASGYDYSPVFAQMQLGHQEGSAPLYIEAQGGPRGKHDVWNIDYIGQSFATPAESSATEIVIQGVTIEYYE